MNPLRLLIPRPRLAGAALLIGGCVLLGSCGGDSAGPKGGTLDATVTGAAADDEAILLDLGGQVTSVTVARADLEVSARPRTGGGYRVAVFGPLAGAPVLRVAVPDRTRPPTVTVREVADSAGSLRPSMAGYGLRFDPVQ